MAWWEENSWLSKAFAPSISTIIITLIIALSLPIAIHYVLYRARTITTTPSFLIAGPSDAGKTAFVTRLQNGAAAETRTSIDPWTSEVKLPTAFRPSSAKYRSANDVEAKAQQALLLRDTPGHGKIRHHAFSSLDALATSAPPNARNVIFLVDSSDLSGGSKGLKEAAEYLYDILLTLQKAYESATSSKSKELHFLIAANKMDLFTSLPTEVVKKNLERELSRLRDTKARGISAVGTKGEGLGGDEDQEDEKDVLGGMGEGDFTFSSMQEYDVHVDIIGGNATGNEGPGVDGWWEWIALQM